MRFHWEQIQSLSKLHHLEDPLSGLPQFQRFLQFWWANKFNRPLKDPLLMTYTLDELLYEYMRYYYVVPENDPKKKMAEQSIKADEDDWIRKQLEKVHEAQQAIDKAHEELDKKAAEPVPEQAPAAPEIAPEPIPDLPDISTKFDE